MPIRRLNKNKHTKNIKVLGVQKAPSTKLKNSNFLSLN